MKKLVSIILALVLVAVLSVSAFAAVSPVAPSIKDYVGGTSTIVTVPNKPSQVTYEAAAKDGYQFVGWEIDSAYAQYIQTDITKLDLTSSPITIVLKDGTVVTNPVLVPKFVPVATQPGQDPSSPDQDPSNPGQDPSSPDQDPSSPDQDPSSPDQPGVEDPDVEDPDVEDPDVEDPDEEPADKPAKGESPKTGDTMAMLALAVAALGGAVVAKKRLSK